MLRMIGPKPDRVDRSTPELPLAAVDGWQINIANLDHAVRAIAAAASRDDGFTVFTLNLDHLVKLRRCAKFRWAYARARFVTADGTPVARLAAQQNPKIERTTGADLVVPLAEAAARLELPVYFFGSTEEVLARTARALNSRCAGHLEIVGEAAPPAGFDPEGPEADAAIARIEASGARLCFVALGAPKQEIFAARAVARGSSVGFVCVGAALDFLAGSQSRAPRLMQIDRARVVLAPRQQPAPHGLALRPLRRAPGADHAPRAGEGPARRARHVMCPSAPLQLFH